jgi:hypothetical protein
LGEEVAPARTAPRPYRNPERKEPGAHRATPIMNIDDALLLVLCTLIAALLILGYI